MRGLYILFQLTLGSSLMAQTSIVDTISPKTKEPVISNPQTLPEYPGGQSALMNYLGSFVPPPNFDLIGLNGKIYAVLEIDTLGKVGAVEILKSSGIDGLDSAFVAHLQNMPDWKPASLYGRPVSIKYVIPINCLKLE